MGTAGLLAAIRCPPVGPIWPYLMYSCWNCEPVQRVLVWPFWKITVPSQPLRLQGKVLAGKSAGMASLLAGWGIRETLASGRLVSRPALFAKSMSVVRIHVAIPHEVAFAVVNRTSASFEPAGE